MLPLSPNHHHHFDDRAARRLVSLYDTADEAREDETGHGRAAGLHRLRPGQIPADSDGLGLPEPHLDLCGYEEGRYGSDHGLPPKLENLVRLAEAHAKMRFSASMELPDVEEAWCLCRETLKQAATGPTSGRIDISILTTGLSAAGRGLSFQIRKNN